MAYVFIYSYLDKKLSYRKQIAHQLCTQYVEGIYSNTVILKSGLEVTKVTENGTILDRHRMRVPICHSTITMALYSIVCNISYWSKIRTFLYPPVFSTPI